MSSYKRNIGESELSYIYRICEQKDAIGTWYDVRDILNAELGRNWNESAYRKKYQSGARYLAENQDAIFEGQEYIDRIRKERETLQQERYKLQTEKLEYNRWMREDARDELFEEKVIQAISENVGMAPTPSVRPIPVSNNNRSAILCIADMHFGADFKIYGIDENVIAEYSPEIFYFRMEKLLNETISHVEKEGITSLKVMNLGDSLDGFLRHSQLQNLRYGVIDSAIIFGDYMAKWLRALSEVVPVEYYQTNGNHGELRLLDGKKNAHLNENIEKVTSHIIEISNKGNRNLKVVKNSSGLIFTDVAGYNILGIHGEVSNMTKAIQEYANIYDTAIHYLVAGHKHHTEFSNCGVRKGCIGIGSVIGTDDYAIKLRKASDATASLIIFEKGKGKTDEHTFVLS